MSLKARERNPDGVKPHQAVRLPPMSTRPASTTSSRPALPLRTSAVIYVLLGLWTFVCVFPLYWIAIFSLKDDYAILQGPFFLPFADFAPTLDAWRFILFDSRESVLARFVNSAVIGIVSTVLTLLLGGMAVYGVTRFRSQRAGWKYAGDRLLFAVLATRLLPPVVVVIPLVMMANSAGLIDTWFALIITYTATNLPVAIWLLRPVVGSVATEQEEAAQLDGASRFGIFLTIFLPMVAAGTAADGLLIFILCWNEYLFAVYLTNDHALTLPPFLASQLSMKEAQVGGETVEWARLCAGIIVMVVPLLAFAGLVQRLLGRMASR